jgi:hypothetical protein
MSTGTDKRKSVPVAIGSHVQHIKLPFSETLFVVCLHLPL